MGVLGENVTKGIIGGRGWGPVNKQKFFLEKYKKGQCGCIKSLVGR